MKKIVLVVAVIFCISLMSCNGSCGRHPHGTSAPPPIPNMSDQDYINDSDVLDSAAPADEWGPTDSVTGNDSVTGGY